MRRLLLSLVILLATASLAVAQTPVFTNTSKWSNANASSSISSNNIFQSVWASNLFRNDCIIQNNGAASMYIFFGPIASATTPHSLTLSSGSIFKCANSGLVSSDQISITGTSGQQFFAIQY